MKRPTPGKSKPRGNSSRSKSRWGPAKTTSIRRILVPVDFSEPSFGAIDYAVSLSKRFDAEIVLVHVFEPEYPLIGLAGMPMFIPDSGTAPRIRQHLTDVAMSRGVPVRPKSIQVIRGRPWEQICRLARRIGIDLIIIPTRGNTGLKHLVLGSTAERVVRHSPCPVLAIKPGRTVNARGKRKSPAASAALRFRKIIVPIDFSACSMKGLAYARSFAREFGSTLIVLHSVHLNYYVTNDRYAFYDFPVVMDRTERAARTQMRNLVRRMDWKGIKMETVIEIGHPGQQICDCAKNYDADLIVTSTHGSTGLMHVLVGSTAEYVVRHATGPVLIVPARMDRRNSRRRDN